MLLDWQCLDANELQIRQSDEKGRPVRLAKNRPACPEPPHTRRPLPLHAAADRKAGGDTNERPIWYVLGAGSRRSHHDGFPPACVAGHEDPAPAGARRHCSIEILVQDPTGASVPDAYVHLSGPTDKRGRTDAEGRFCAEAGRSGRYLAVVEKTGFGKASDSFTLEEAAGGRVIEIRPAAVRLAIDVVAAPELASESVERITASLLETPRSVAVFDAIQLRERNFRNVHDLLAFVPGLSPNSLRAGGYHYTPGDSACCPKTRGWTGPRASRWEAATAPRHSASNRLFCSRARPGSSTDRRARREA